MYAIYNMVYNSSFILGHRDKSGAYELVLNGHINVNAGIGEATVYAVVQKVSGEPTAVALIIDIKALTPLKAISVLIKKELNDIPLIKDFTANLIIEYASADMMVLKDVTLNKILFKYIAYAKTISKGLFTSCHI